MGWLGTWPPLGSKPKHITSTTRYDSGPVASALNSIRLTGPCQRSIRDLRAQASTQAPNIIAGTLLHAKYMDRPTESQRIKKLKKIERKARDYADARAWKLAEPHYEELFLFAQGWLAPNDPNVLWAYTHLTEAWIELDKIDDAIKAHEQLFDLIDQPDTEDERDVLAEMMYLQIDIVNKLNVYQREKDALNVLQNTLEVSNDAFGRRHDITAMVRDRYHKLSQWALQQKSGKKGKHHKHRRRQRDKRLSAEGERNDIKVDQDDVSPSPGDIESRTPVPLVISPSENEVRSGGGGSVGLGINLAQHQKTRLGTDRPRALSAQGLVDRSPFRDTRGRPTVPPKPSLLSSPRKAPESKNSQRVSSAQLKPVGFQDDESPSDRFLSPATTHTARSRSVDLTGSKLESFEPGFSDATLLSTTDDSLNQAADEWFSKFLKETHKFLRVYNVLKSGPGRRPRIAILDTGLNTEHDKVKKLYSKDVDKKRFQGFWAPPTTSWRAEEDIDGHGTHCAMVAHKAAPDADLFILKVFLDRGRVVGDHIVEALEHAVSFWKVDIISMSFALDKNDRNKPDISKKLEEIQDKVLLFAAASNSGINRSRGYPAKLDGVISIHAASGRGAKWGDNPKPYAHDFNFSTLGMFVKAPHKDQNSERSTGTSVAAPIAAGIAALVLEFCRQEPVVGQKPLKHPERLKAKRGMAMIFRQMYNRFEPTAEGPEHDYFYLAPWLWMAQKDIDEDASEARCRIAFDINGALNSLDE